MEKTSLVLTAGWNNHSTFQTIEVNMMTFSSSILILFFHTCFLGKRDIRALPVKCDNVERGCEEEGTLGTLEEHMAVCQFTPVPCPKQCEDTILLLRKDLDYHINNECPNRDCECEYCGVMGTYANITRIHYALCKEKVVPCHNEGCTQTMKRRMIDDHVEDDCEYTEVSCKYANIGCEVKLKRKGMKTHEEDDKIHLHLALDAVVKLNDKNVQLHDTSLQLRDTIGRLEYGLQLANCKIKFSSKKRKKKKAQETVLTTFKLTDYQHKVENDEDFMSPPFYTSPEGYHMSIKVDANGNGNGEGTHVSVFVYILEGRNDSKLKWPFIGSVKIELLNQLEDGNHHIKTLPYKMEHNTRVGDNRNWGYSHFIPNSKLHHNPPKKIQYLKDDTLYFRVSVEVPDHQPWLECTVK